MRKALFGVFLTLLCAAGARAQAPYKVQFTIDGESTPVAAAVEARIGGTTRYTLTDSVSSDGFLLGIMCFKNELQGGIVSGYTCISNPTYYPPGEYSAIPEDLPEGMVTCGRDAPEECAESIFDTFTQETQPDKLKKQDELARKTYDSIFLLGYIKGLSDAKQNCKAQTVAPKRPKGE